MLIRAQSVSHVRRGWTPPQDGAKPAVLQPDGSVRPYPKAPTSDKVERVRGRRVRDPYRPLEHMHSAPTRQWVARQNRLSESYLSKIPERAEFAKALDDAYIGLRGLQEVVRGRLFYTKGIGKEQALICSSDTNGRGERVLLNPNKFSTDGHVAIDEWKVSPDGKKLAYALRRNGSDELEWRIRDIASSKDLPDRLHGGRFGTDGLTWSPNSDGFYYHRYKEPLRGQTLSAVIRYDNTYFHRLGTSQSHDQPWNSPNLPAFQSQSWEDKHGNEYKRIADNDETTYWLAKGKDYPRGAVVKGKVDDYDSLRVVVAERKDTLDDVTFAHGQFFAQYLQDAHSRVLRFDEHGKRLGEVNLPGMGTVGGFHKASRGRVIYSYSDPLHPHSVYVLNTKTQATHAVFQPRPNFDPKDYQTHLVLAPSKDGTKIPLYITHRKDVPMDGRRPTYLYAYGGFNSNETPAFNWSVMPWLNKGGVYVTAALRGGGEFGEQWHKDGMRLRKQHVFDDFIAAGEWLVKKGVTSPQHLAIGGASNGGLLVAATELQRPDLFGAAVPDVAVTDMVRFPRFTGGFHWINEYGEISKPKLLGNMLSYSPLHNIKQGRAYPATLVITGDHDDRVVPAHSYKFAAALQQAQGSNDPVLLSVNRNIGHGFGMPLSMKKDENANRWAFLWHHVGASE